jgi:thiamine biosynthesis lipoprotein
MAAPQLLRTPALAASWEALGTTIALRVTEPDALERARAAVEGELGLVDETCSRFRADSELVRVNERSGRTVSLSPLLGEALALALRAAELSDGDVDPTVGRALELCGYDRDWRALAPDRGEPPMPAQVSARVRSGWRTIAFAAPTLTVRVPAGIRLDLGATAKAWAADRAAKAAARACESGVLVGVGGDLASAGAPPEGGWSVHVTDDHRSGPDAPGQTVRVRSGGLATSSAAVRRWSHGGHSAHHIIDPATGAPAGGPWRTVSVAAARCADANIATTAALVRGERAAAWLESLGLPARLVGWDGRVVTLSGWPASQARQEDAR